MEVLNFNRNRNDINKNDQQLLISRYKSNIW